MNTGRTNTYHLGLDTKPAKWLAVLIATGMLVDYVVRPLFNDSHSTSLPINVPPAILFNAAKSTEEISPDKIQSHIQTKHGGLVRALDFDFNQNGTEDRVYICKDGTWFYQENHLSGKNGFVKAPPASNKQELLKRFFDANPGHEGTPASARNY